MIENLDPQQLVDYVGHTNAALQKSAAQVQELATIKEQTKQAAEFIPGVVAALIENHRIEPSHKEAAEAALLDHAKTLQLMGRLATHRNEKEAAAIGKPVDDGHNKVAAFQSIGAHSDTVRPSDRQLFERFGVPLSE